MATAMIDLQVLCLLSLGEAQLRGGLREEARVLGERALAHARAHQERGHQAYARRVLGEIAARREPPEREFAYDLLQAVSPWGEDTVQRGLQQLVAAEFLVSPTVPASSGSPQGQAPAERCHCRSTPPDSW